MRSLAAFAVATFLTVTTAYAQSSLVPTLIPHSDVLLTQSGMPRTGTVQLTISLYAGQSDPTPLWFETQVVTLDADGGYLINVGATVAGGLPLSLFSTGSAKWMGIQVDSETEQPRMRLVGVPYAAAASTATTASTAAVATSATALDGRPVGDFVLNTQLAGSVSTALQTPEVQASLNGQFAGLNTPPMVVNAVPKFIDTTGRVDDSVIREVGGNVGVGTTATPFSEFEVRGAQSGNPATSGSTDANATLRMSNAVSPVRLDIGTGAQGTWLQSRDSGNFATNSQLALNPNGGNVGIGVVQPLTSLHTNATSGVTFRLTRTASAAGSLGLLQFGNQNFDPSLAEIGGYQESASQAGYLAFGTQAAAASVAERLRITSVGNVGIGTTAPARKLEVASGELRLGAGFAVEWGSANDRIFAQSSAFNVVTAGTTRLHVNNVGNVGIGTIVPAYRLDVAGGALNASGGLCIAGDCRTSWANLVGPSLQMSSDVSGVNSQLKIFKNTGADTDRASLKVGYNDNDSLEIYRSRADANIYVKSGQSGANMQFTINNGMYSFRGGNLGVGTLEPLTQLHVQGDPLTDAALRVHSYSGNDATLQLEAENANGADASIRFGDNVNLTRGQIFYGIATGSSLDDSMVFSTNGATRMAIDSTGKVGVGTLTPAFALDVQGGALNASGGLCIAGTCRTTWADSNPWLTQASNIGYTAGSVGIGTTTPGYKADVQGGQLNASGGLCINGDCKASWSEVGGGGQWTTSGTNLVFASGNVGIGTLATPETPLQVRVPDADASQVLFLLRKDTAIGAARMFYATMDPAGSRVLLNSDGSGATAVKLGLGVGPNTSHLTIVQGGKVGVATENPTFPFEVNGDTRLGSSTQGALLVRNLGASAAVLRPAVANGSLLISDDSELATRGLTIRNGGSVGIGIALPQAALHVAGNVIVDGNIGAKYQDVAEWVDADAPLEPGTIVTIDVDATNRVTSSSGSYDQAIAGAISAQPGLVLGEAGEGRVLVAQSGRVRVKVDASFGAIKPGDLLVTSPTKGHAMKSVPVDIGGFQMHRPGTVLGKALEGLAEGQGDILALLTLQ
jgi:hypothetical protein